MMDLRPVSVAASGPLAFRCCQCGCRASQAVETVYADIAGKPWHDYYCSLCAARRQEV